MPLDSQQEQSPASRKATAWRIVRALGSLLGFLYIAWLIDDWSAVANAARSTPAMVGLLALGLVSLNVVLGAARWRILLWSYGASEILAFSHLIRLYFIGFFYNTYLPGAVGGDVVRGVVTKNAFGPSGAVASLTVVLVERLLGLSGLFIVGTTALLLYPIEELSMFPPWALLATLALVTGCAVVGNASQLAPRLPARIGDLLGRLPALQSPLGLAGALGISILVHGAIAVAGWLLLHSQWEAISLTQALVIVPVASAATFLPFTVGGAGAREAVLVFLCTTITEMGETEAVTGSILLWLCLLTLGAVGGLLQLAAKRLA